MSIFTDGTHKTVLEGSIYPGPLIRYEILYETNLPYGQPVQIQKVFPDLPKEQKNPLSLGDAHRHGIFNQLHKLLTGELTLTENRKLLTDRPNR